jgi:DNA-binding transcriptional ArsR family regulator
MENERLQKKAALLRAKSLFLSALANETRVQIVLTLANEEKSIKDIAATLNLGQSMASHHLAILERAGIVKVTKTGAKRCCGLRSKQTMQIIDGMRIYCVTHDIAQL